MTAVGLDLSLTETGMFGDFGEVLIKPPAVKLTDPVHKRLERFEFILQAIGERIDSRDPELVIIEGFSFASKGSTVDQTHGLGWIVRWSLDVLQQPFAIVPPATIKKFATGSSNADKDKMLASAIRHGYPGDNNNGADAWWAYQIGRVALQEISCTVDQYETLERSDGLSEHLRGRLTLRTQRMVST